MDNKDQTICRLMQAIEDFKVYDIMRMEYYSEKLKELGVIKSELAQAREELCELKSERNFMNEVHALRIIREKAAMFDMHQLAKEFPEEFTPTPDVENITRKLQSMRNQIKNLNEKCKKLMADNERLIYELTQAKTNLD